MAEQRFNEDGTVKRDFPVKLVAPDGETARMAFTEADVVSAEWDGYQTEESVKARAAAEKATKQAEKDTSKS